MHSIVCGMIPSLAAITSTIISVAFTPLDLIAENAAWPGVSRNVIVLPVAMGTASVGVSKKFQTCASEYGEFLQHFKFTRKCSNVLRYATCFARSH